MICQLFFQHASQHTGGRSCPLRRVLQRDCLSYVCQAYCNSSQLCHIAHCTIRLKLSYCQSHTDPLFKANSFKFAIYNQHEEVISCNFKTHSKFPFVSFRVHKYAPHVCTVYYYYYYYYSVFSLHSVEHILVLSF